MRQLVAPNALENMPPGGAAMVHAHRQSSDGGLPFISGHVVLIAGKAARRTPVVLKIHSPAFGGPYAVLAPDKGAAIKDCGALSLRNCSVRLVPTSGATERSFQVASTEGSTLTFCVTSDEELIMWVEALTHVTSSSAGRNRKPLQALDAQCNSMSQMAGRRRTGACPVAMPSLEEEESVE